MRVYTYNDGFSPQKAQRIRKQFGEELTYSTYLQLRELEINDKQICLIYNIPRTTFWEWRRPHLDHFQSFTPLKRGGRRKKVKA